MEIIGYGILLAIGWYVAPFVIMTTIAIVGGVFVGICRLFGGCK